MGVFAQSAVQGSALGGTYAGAAQRVVQGCGTGFAKEDVKVDSVSSAAAGRRESWWVACMVVVVVAIWQG